MTVSGALKIKLGQLRQALSSAQGTGERLQLLEQEVFVLEAYPQAEAVPVVNEMVDQAEASEDFYLMTAGLWILAEHARRCGDCPAAIEYASRLRQAAHKAGNSETEAIARLLEGRVLEHTGQFEAARNCYEKALVSWQQERTADGRRIALGYLSALMLRQGLPSSALNFCQEALEIDSENQSRWEQAVGLLRAGCAFIQLGHWEDAAEHLFRSVTLAEKYGLNAVLFRALNALGEMFLRRDRPERAAEFFSRVVRAARRAGADPDAMCEGLVGLVAACYSNSDLAAAERALEEGIACCERCGDFMVRATLHRLTAELALARGRIAEAESSVQRALEFAQRAGAKREAGRALSILGQIAADREDIDGAVALFERALASLEEVEDRYDLGKVRLQYGRMLLNAGHLSAARAQLNEAEHIFRDLGIAGQIAETSRLLFKATAPEGGDVALLAAVAGLGALRLDPTSFLERALRLMRDGLGFDSAAVIAGKQPVVVCGEPEVKRALSLCAGDDDVLKMSETALFFPIRFDGRTLAWVYLERRTPARVTAHPLLLQGLASMLARQVRELTIGAGSSGTRSEVIAGLKYRGVIGRNPKMLKALRIVAKVASAPIPVMIRGESGTGKELIARALHESGSRAGRPFIPVNCAAVPETLLESDFFGVAKGAATGVSPRKGKFELADGGTIFLDEIGDMSLALQAKLLRVLQEKRFERVGGDRLIMVDVRVVAATNQNLEEQMEKGLFRRDLYYRLNGVEIELPALRERKEDIPELIRYFIDRFAREFGRPVTRVSPEVMQLLMDYDWPGNIRELQNILERAVVLCKENDLGIHDLPPELCRSISTTVVSSAVTSFVEPGDLRSVRRQARNRAVAELEKAMLIACLNRANWNFSKAAELAGYSRPHFYRLLRKHNISRT